MSGFVYETQEKTQDLACYYGAVYCNLGCTDMDTGKDTGTDTTQRYKKFLKNYNTEQYVQHRYDTGTTPQMKRPSILDYNL